jgi:hypothetical protein
MNRWAKLVDFNEFTKSSFGRHEEKLLYFFEAFNHFIQSGFNFSFKHHFHHGV